jgi:hypothetical protein
LIVLFLFTVVIIVNIFKRPQHYVSIGSNSDRKIENKVQLGVVNPTKDELSKRKALYKEIKWSKECEDEFDFEQSSAVSIKSNEIKPNIFILEIPCGMTNQGPYMSYVYYDKSKVPTEVKQLNLERYTKLENGQYNKVSTETIPTLGSNFNKNTLELSAYFRSTSEAFGCYYNWSYKFNFQTKNLDLIHQDHLQTCSTGGGQLESPVIIDFPRL